MNNSIDALVSDKDVENFQRDGVAVVRQVFDQQWIDLLRLGLEKSMEVKGSYVWNFHDDKNTGAHFHNENRRWPDIEEYRRFLFDSPVAELCARFGRWQNAYLLYDSAFLRSPGTATKTPWHHDQPYVCIDGQDALISAWTPLVPVESSSGLECIRGSHKWNKNFFRLNFNAEGPKGHMATKGDSESQWDELPDIDTDRDNYDIVSYSLEPGDTLIIHGKIVHGSPGNQRKDRPVAVVTARMLGDSAIYLPDKPGGTQPDLKEDAAACGLQAGSPVSSTLFPHLWTSN